MTPKQLERMQEKLIRRKHELIRELDSINIKINNNIRLMASPKLRRLEKVEVQKGLDTAIVQRRLE